MFLLTCLSLLLCLAHSQRPTKDGGGGGGGGSGGGNTCSADIDTANCKAAGSTTSCASNLYVSFSGMVYNNATGKFTGNVVTNQCRYYDNKNDARHTPDCCGEQLGPNTQDKFPSRGRVAWSIKGQNIYGPFEAGFGKEGVTKDNSDVTKNTQPPYPCFNEASGKYYGYCSPGIDVATCEESLQVLCDQKDILTSLFLDECGGHATPYHHHNELKCYYDHSVNTHSPIVGIGKDGTGIYGLYEKDKTAPTDLDACNGHVGPVPSNSDNTYFGVQTESTEVYHYHTTLDFPFTIGCYGPLDEKGCSGGVAKGSDTECGDGEYVEVEVPKEGGGAEIVKHPSTAKGYDAYCSCRFSGGFGSGPGVTTTGEESGGSTGGSSRAMVWVAAAAAMFVAFC